MEAIGYESLYGRIPDSHYEELVSLDTQLFNVESRNRLRSQYYDMKNTWHDLGIAIPPRFRNIEVASGWPSKAVDHLARRVRFESFTHPGGESTLDSFGIPEIWDDNDMDSGFSQATVSALIHSPGFLLTWPGDTSQGEPEIVYTELDALHATGRWNWSRNGLDSALLILDVSDADQPTRMMLFVEDQVYHFTRDVSKSALLAGLTSDWEVEVEDNPLPRIPVEPLLYHPRTSRPFGASRITRAVMYITQGAMRTFVGSELGAEFFATPQRYALNVEREDLLGPNQNKSEWDVVIGKLLTLGMSENPEDPDPVLGQFPQVSMQPHVEMARMWAMLMSGETGIPVGSLGIIQDNPSSAEAIYAAKEDLVLEAEEVGRTFTPALRRSMVNAIMLREGLSVPPKELRRLGVRWIDPSTPSRNQATDAVMKQVEGGVLLPDSSVTTELLGYSPDVIRRLAEDRRRAVARETVRAALATGAGQTPSLPPGEVVTGRPATPAEQRSGIAPPPPPVAPQG